MKTQPKKGRILILISLITAIIIIMYEVYNFDSVEWTVFSTIHKAFIYGICLITGLLVLKKSINLYRNTKFKMYLIPVLIFGFTLLVNTGIFLVKNNISTAPSLIKATFVDDNSRLTLNLKSNNTYKYQTNTLFGGDIIYGQYEIEGDTLYLFENNIEENDIPSEKFILSSDKILFRKDSVGEYITDYYVMTIFEDNRSL